MRKLITLTLCAALLWASFGVPLRLPVGAQGSVQATTRYALRVYSGPARSTVIIGVLVPHTQVILEGRSPDTAWVLGRSLDGTLRGWVESRYLHYDAAIHLDHLSISAEEMFVPSQAHARAAYTAINLQVHPVVPESLGQARAIFERGQALGRDPYAVGKVGDCISDNRYFLSPFGWKQYNLGTYTYLEPVIEHFAASMTYDSLAAYDGLVTSAVLDPTFANPLACRPGESPLRCEYRVHNPSVVIIMFGAQDLLYTRAEDFDRNMRHIVHETIQAGVVPILSTFPANLKLWNDSVLFNQIIVQIALDYDIPLMNLWVALDGLPNHGLNDDGRHPSPPLTDAGDLTGENLQRGFPMRNLVTLQALDVVWRGAMQP